MYINLNIHLLVIVYVEPTYGIACSSVLGSLESLITTFTSSSTSLTETNITVCNLAFWTYKTNKKWKKNVRIIVKQSINVCWSPALFVRYLTLPVSLWPFSMLSTFFFEIFDIFDSCDLFSKFLTLFEIAAVQ